MTKCYRLLLIIVALNSLPATGQYLPSAPANRLLIPNNTGSIAFTWKGDSLHQQWEPYAALLLPVTLPDCPGTWYMQFDLGAPSSLFYSRPLQAIRQRYPRSLSAADTIRLANYAFRIGNMPVTASAIRVQATGDSNINWSPGSVNIIGTIGADLIENRVAIINYPGKQLVLSDTIAAPIRAGTSFSDLLFIQNRVLLPATIKGKTTILYFDTGSSAFELLTDKNTWDQLAVPGATPVHYPVQSWNTTLFANTIASADSITIGSMQLPLHQVTWIEGASAAQINQMMKMGIGGMTGNKLFLHHTLILDTRNKKFALLPQ